MSTGYHRLSSPYLLSWNVDIQAATMLYILIQPSRSQNLHIQLSGSHERRKMHIQQNGIVI